MRTVKIVADSSANVMQLQQVDFACAPLKIITEQREFVDNHQLNIDEMVSFFDGYKCKSKTSCPNPEDWLAAFGDADDLFCVTITSGLSGSYNSACVAKQLYESQQDGKRVFVIDSLSAGPELVLLIEKLQELITAGHPFEKICNEITAYQRKTGLLFMLASLQNFAANGRVPVAVAKIAGVLGIRVVGTASNQGTLQPLDKVRGEEKSLIKILEHLKTAGFLRGKVRIAHCQNQTAAENLAQKIRSRFPLADVQIASCLGLCSYYAEKGGLLVGYEIV